MIYPFCNHAAFVIIPRRKFCKVTVLEDCNLSFHLRHHIVVVPVTACDGTTNLTARTSGCGNYTLSMSLQRLPVHSRLVIETMLPGKSCEGENITITDNVLS